MKTAKHIPKSLEEAVLDLYMYLKMQENVILIFKILAKCL